MRERLAPGGRAASVIVTFSVVAGLVAGCGSGSHKVPVGQPSTSGTVASASSVPPIAPPTTAGTAAMLAAGRVGRRHDVPWNLVGPGWLLATWTKTAQGPAGPAATLYLVDPFGGMYNLGHAPAGQLMDWSGDGLRALFQQGSASDQVVIEDLKSGSLTPILGSSNTYASVRFTKPAGLAVMESGQGAAGGNGAGPRPVQRFSLSGSLQEAYPTSFPVAGTTYGSFIESPDGTKVVLATTNGFEVTTNNGKPIRSLAQPAGTPGCGLSDWWGADSVLVSCGGQLWGLPVDGAAPTELVHSGDTLLDGWSLSSGMIVEGAACGTTWLDRVNADGSTSRLNVPGTPIGGSVFGLGVYLDRLGVLLTPNCEVGPGAGSAQRSESRMLGWYLPASNAVSPLLGGTLGGSVVAALLFGQDRPGE